MHGQCLAEVPPKAISNLAYLQQAAPDAPYRESVELRLFFPSLQVIDIWISSLRVRGIDV